MKVLVNQKKLLQDLKLTFTDPYVVLRELLQNARRAGARNVRIDYDEEDGILEVFNDGDPLENFQDLIHVAESGWNPELKDEKPYGLGFLGVLFASEEYVKVNSYTGKGKEEMLFDPKELMEGQDIGEPIFYEYRDEDPVKGVLVTLKVSKLKKDEIREQMRYFDTEVNITLNGVKVERAPARYSVKIPEGILEVNNPFNAIYNLEGNQPISFQGFKCAYQGGSYCNATGYIIKLDKVKFDARLPDRNYILGYTDEVRDDLLAHVLHGFRYILETEVPESELLLGHQFLKRLGMLHILDDIDTLPAELCYTPVDKDDLEWGSDNSNYRYSYDNSTPRKEVRRSGVVVQVPSLEVSNETLPALLTALKLGGSVCTIYGNTPVMSSAELGRPATGETYLNPRSLHNKNIDRLVVYSDPEEVEAYHVLGGDLYINTVRFHAFNPMVALRVLDDYEEDYKYQEWAHMEDARSVISQVELHMLTQDPSGVLDFDKVFHSCVVQHNFNVPEVMHNRVFVMVVDGKGNLSLAERSENM